MRYVIGAIAPTSPPQFQIRILFTLPAISLLPLPEHHIFGPGKKESSDPNLARTPRSPFPFLELDIVRRDDLGK